ncbi:MAG: tmRNA-binding protein SmpB [Ignavibacteriae bacterium]|nr:MAG: tmRNA-binding protein SmpB [Ignavibacteriota bacterium]
MTKTEANEEKVLITNRKAQHDYFIIETYEAGIVLKGTEVKSLRAGNANLQDSFAVIKNGEVWLENMHISHYPQASYNNHEPKRDRKLLLHKKEIRRLKNKLEEKGTTLVPLRVYLKKQKIKIELALARGKKSFDKREAIAKRETEREIKRKYAL